VAGTLDPSLEAQPIVSQDGYVRMTFPFFCTLRFPRRLVIEDRSLLIKYKARNVPALKAGYCDWLDETTPVTLIIGWAWYETSASRLVVHEGISSNVMLLTVYGADCSRNERDTLLHFWLERQHWRNNGCKPGDITVH